MGRPTTVGSLVPLPRLTAMSASKFIQELLTAAAAEKKLPPVIAADRDELAEAVAVLDAELVKRHLGEWIETPQVGAADGVEDNAVGALVDFLRATARLPVERHPEAAQASEILDTVFGQGLGFLAIRPDEEWKQVDLRIEALKSKGYWETIEKLGGKRFLDEIEHAHAKYGEALGITAVKKEAPEPPAVRAAYDAAVEAIRTYVIRVSAHVQKKDPKTAELAERLLAPLANWRDAASKASAKKDAAKKDAAKGKEAAKTEPAAKPEPEKAPVPS